MASPGLLFLLLVSSSLLLSSMSTPSSNRQESHALQKRVDAEKATEYFLKFVQSVDPFVALIPVCGKYLSPILKVVNIWVGKPDPTQASEEGQDRQQAEMRELKEGQQPGRK